MQHIKSNNGRYEAFIRYTPHGATALVRNTTNGHQTSRGFRDRVLNNGYLALNWIRGRFRAYENRELEEARTARMREAAAGRPDTEGGALHDLRGESETSAAGTVGTVEPVLPRNSLWAKPPTGA
jgi:hypothetical protein